MSGTHLFRSYAYLDSPVHRVPAAAKLAATLVLVTGLALVPTGRAARAAAALAVVLVLARVARIPLPVFVARLALVQPFVLSIAVLALFQGRGLAVFAAIALKTTTCVAAVQLLVHTTRFPELLEVLRRARLPAPLLATLALLHRYLFVLLEESQRMRRARTARTWQPGRWRAWQALSSVIAVSFVRSMARAERISAAMQARGGP